MHSAFQVHHGTTQTHFPFLSWIAVANPEHGFTHSLSSFRMAADTHIKKIAPTFRQ